MKISEYLDKAKAVTGSDGKTAEKIGVTKQAVSNWRQGTSHPDAHACANLADIIGAEELEIVAVNGMETEKTPERREYWKKKLAELGGIAASIFAAVILIVTPYPAEAAPAAKIASQDCILCKIRKLLKLFSKIKIAALALCNSQILAQRHCSPG